MEKQKKIIEFTSKIRRFPSHLNFWKYLKYQQSLKKFFMLPIKGRACLLKALPEVCKIFTSNQYFAVALGFQKENN